MSSNLNAVKLLSRCFLIQILGGASSANLGGIKKKKRLILLVRTHDERKNFNKLREHINAKVF